VTGGEDRKVNLWTAGKPNCIMVSMLILEMLNDFIHKREFIVYSPLVKPTPM